MKIIYYYSNFCWAEEVLSFMLKFCLSSL